MSDKSHRKGRILEDAVAKIQRLILAHDPNLQGRTFSVQGNKIVYDRGVPNEIDVYVEVDDGRGGNLVYIFECKNRDRESVSKNDVVILDHKVKLCNARHGFLIARRIGKYARTQVKNLGNMTLLGVNTQFNETDFRIGVFVPRQNHVNIEIFFSNGKPPYEIPVEQANVAFGGRNIEIKDFIKPFCEEMISKEIKPSLKCNVEKLYSFRSEKILSSFNESLYMNGEEVLRMTIFLEFEIRYIPSVVKSVLDVEKMGAFVDYQEVSLGEQSVLFFKTTLAR